MTKEELIVKPKDEIINFIKDRLSIKSLDNKKIKEEELKSLAHKNLNILNRFADLGIYEKTQYLILDYKTLHLQYYGNKKEEMIDLSNLDTSEIIYTVFKKTIFLNKRVY